MLRKQDIQKLKEAAMAATHGPWATCSASESRCQCRQVWSRPADIPIAYALRDTDEDWTGGDGATHEMAKNNATFIAAADPPTILALIDRMERAEMDKVMEDLLIEKCKIKKGKEA